MNKGGNNPYSSPMSQSAPMGGSGAGQLATLLERFLGALIDGIVVMLVAGPVIGILLFLQVLSLGSMIGLIVYSVVASLIGGVVFCAINWFLLNKNGQTVGKMVMKTKIVSASTGAQLPAADVIIKRYVPIWAAGVVPYLGGLAVLVDAVMIFRENRHRFVDDLAQTKVISVK